MKSMRGSRVCGMLSFIRCRFLLLRGAKEKTKGKKKVYNFLESPHLFTNCALGV